MRVTHVDADGMDAFLREQFRQHGTLKRQVVAFSAKDGEPMQARTYYKDGLLKATAVYRRSEIAASDPWVCIGGSVYQED